MASVKSVKMKNANHRRSGRTAKADRIRKILLWILVLGMLLPMIVGITSLWAVSQSDIDKVNAKIADLQKKKTSTSKELEALRQDIDAVLEQKLLLDEKINLCNEEIELICESIEILERQLADNNVKLCELNEQKEAKYELFKKRLRVLYEQGRISYLAVILEADSIEDFLNRTELVGEILKQDKKTINEIERLSEDAKALTAQLEADKKEADEKYAALSAVKAELEADYNESVALMSALEDEEKANADLLLRYEQAWKNANAEEDRLAALLEKQRREAAATTAETTTAATTAPPAATEPAATTAPSTPPVSGTPVSVTYMWPTPGVTWITSSYGYRYHPVTGTYSFHSGIDIGACYGTSILCIADGIVVSNTYSSVFGNMIKVDHGNGIVSLYGHLNAKSKLAVGKSVKKGAVLGYVGSTGLSTGPHLHLTIYKNGATVNPLSYVKPK